MIHRDLSNPTHQTNLHLHYDLPYVQPESAGGENQSFFSIPTESPINFTPKDPSVHKPLSIKQVLERRLSWVTLGGQYDWTNRVYPDQQPPSFPPDISDFLSTLFPETEAQAAIVNFYSPGDTMMMHRDVSEETDKGLVSLSIGCEALFMIAPSRSNGGNVEETTKSVEAAGTESTRKPYLLLRLRSGDAIYMTQESRYAWHGVPKVLKGTCPDFLVDWPAEDGKYQDWKGWMSNKRINLNVRQMRE
jgi:DNA alkylation damage repair protein AlkB